MTRPIVLDMLEEYERLKTEAATLAQLARDLYDGEEITPEAALRRLHQECMDARYENDALRRERHAERQRVDERDAEIQRLKAESEEQRLTLLAERGDAEGAPSGWRYVKPGGWWERGSYPLSVVQVMARSDGWWSALKLGVPDGPIAVEKTARAAMLAVNAATASPDRPSPSGGA